MSAVEQPQHLRALDIANEKRGRMADLKRGLKAGTVSLPDVIDSQVETTWDDIAPAMPVATLLRAVHRVGAERAMRLLWELGEYRQGVKLERLGPIRRAQLADILRRRKIGTIEGSEHGGL